MATHTHTTYSCDRCKTDMGSVKRKHPQEATVTASFNWSEGPGPTFKWVDLCEPCRDDVFKFFEVK